MSQKAKRVWAAGAVGVAAVGAAVAALLIWQMQVNPARGEEPGGGATAEPLDPMTYSRVSELRGRLRLSDATLAAMGCTRQQAEGVLTRLVTWDRANGPAWVARREQVAAARAVLRRMERRTRTGPRNPTLLARLPALRQAVEQAKQAEAALIATAVQQVEAGLSETQRRLWATVRANPQGAYAFAPSLTAAQRRALTQAHRRLARDHATGRTAADHEAAEERFRNTVDGILTATQKAAIELAATNTRQFLPTVTAAWQAILPPPAAPGDPNTPA